MDDRQPKGQSFLPVTSKNPIPVHRYKKDKVDHPAKSKYVEFFFFRQ